MENSDLVSNLGHDRARGQSSGPIPVCVPGGYEERFTVPDNRVGTVIGRHGETIRQINQKSGAHCRVDKNTQGQSAFMIRGAKFQIELAKILIMDKVKGFSVDDEKRPVTTLRQQIFDEQAEPYLETIPKEEAHELRRDFSLPSLKEDRKRIRKIRPRDKKRK